MMAAKGCSGQKVLQYDRDVERTPETIDHMFAIRGEDVRGTFRQRD